MPSATAPAAPPPATEAPAAGAATVPAHAAKMEARRLVISYGGKPAIRDVSLEIPERQVTALIGPSGCGKSTFLRALNRMNDLIPGASHLGEVLLDGPAEQRAAF